MNKKNERKSRFALTILLAGITFGIVFLFMLMLSAVVIFLSKAGIVSVETSRTVNHPLLTTLLILFCLMVGAAFSFLLSRILTKPINKVINAINQLANGNYKARIDTGDLLNRHPTIIEIAESFNKMADQLDKTEILRSDFVNNFSHEFKTPIVSIAGFAKLLKRGNLTEEEKLEYIGVIEEESLRLSAMATNMLQLTKIENQNTLSDINRYNVSEQIRNCFLLLEDKWRKKDLELDLLFGEYEIEADEDLLKQIWLNLIDNAIKFSEPGSVIHVSIVRVDGGLSFSIIDTGTDIPQASLPYIFNKFYQADESHSCAGNGIGLAVVRQIVKMHEGKISVQSGNGTTKVTVFLPQS